MRARALPSFFSAVSAPCTLCSLSIRGTAALLRVGQPDANAVIARHCSLVRQCVIRGNCRLCNEHLHPWPQREAGAAIQRRRGSAGSSRQHPFEVPPAHEQESQRAQ